GLMLESKVRVETSDPRRVIKAATPPVPTEKLAPKPKPSAEPATEEPDAGIADAGDAGDEDAGAADAGLPDAGAKPLLGGPWKKPLPTPSATAALPQPSAKPTAASTEAPQP